jgi:sugar phosphate permease
MILHLAPSSQKIIPTGTLHKTQLQVFFTMITLYTFYFASNYNLGPAARFIQEDYSLSNSQFGILFTIFTLGFGLGQFAAGYLGDRYNPKLLMLLGALGAVMANVGFGLSHSMTGFCIFWAVNSLSLSMGWSPGCSILFRWIPPRKQGIFMGFFDAFAFLGGIIIYPIAGFAITYISWRAVFFIPPVLLALWTILFFFIVKSTPEEKGYVVEWKSDGDNRKATGRDYWNILKDPTMNLLCLTAICSQFVRWGLVNWIIKILTEPVGLGGYGLALITAAAIASAMHWGGAFFSIGMGWISDTLFNSSRWQTICIGFLISAVTLGLVFFAGDSLASASFGLPLLTLLLFLAGGCIQGVQAPIFNLPGDLLGPNLGGTGVGIVNGWSYIGASFAGGALGWIMDHYSLASGLILMAFVSLAGALIMLIIRR